MNAAILFILALARIVTGRYSVACPVEVALDASTGTVTELRAVRGTGAGATRVLRNLLGRCKSCRKGTCITGAVTCMIVVRLANSSSTVHLDGVVTANRIIARGSSGAYVAACGCGARVMLHEVQARRITEHVCGSKCMASTGPSCDCSCGGRNHGRSFVAV